MAEFATTFTHCGRSSANARVGGLLTDMLLVMGNPGRSGQLSALIASAAILLSLSALPICRPYTYEQDGMQNPFFCLLPLFFKIQYSSGGQGTLRTSLWARKITQGRRLRLFATIFMLCFLMFVSVCNKWLVHGTRSTTAA